MNNSLRNFCILANALFMFSVSLAQEAALPKAKQIALPKLLTNSFYKLKTICKDSQTSGFRFALVAVKSHACDSQSQAGLAHCLILSRELSDPANHWMKTFFSLYHIRPMAYSKMVDDKKLIEFPESALPDKFYSKMLEDFEIEDRPASILIDVSKCRPIGVWTVVDSLSDWAKLTRKKRIQTINVSLKTFLANHKFKIPRKKASEVNLTLIRKTKDVTDREIWNAMNQQRTHFLSSKKRRK